MKIVTSVEGYDFCGKTLGKGAFARVELATHRLTDTHVAVKIVNSSECNDIYAQKNIWRETTILQQLHHDNILSLYDTMSYRGKLYLVTELIGGGDLLSLVRKRVRLSEKQARDLFKQIVSALAYMHERGIVHRDLNMQNVMLTSDRKTVKIVDFGLSNFFNKEEMLATQCGSAEYAAPELFEKNKKYGSAVEIWSLGVILHAMTLGRMPFIQSKGSLRAQIQSGLQYKDVANESISKGLKSLLLSMLEVNPSQRITLEGVLNHKWVIADGEFATNEHNEELDMRLVERVAALHEQTYIKTAKQLQEEKIGATNATYKILRQSATNNRRKSLQRLIAPYHHLIKRLSI